MCLVAVSFTFSYLCRMWFVVLEIGTSYVEQVTQLLLPVQWYTFVYAVEHSMHISNIVLSYIYNVIF